jgi:hypothetical protein
VSSDSGDVERLAPSGAFLVGVLRERKLRGKAMWWREDIAPRWRCCVVVVGKWGGIRREGMSTRSYVDLSSEIDLQVPVIPWYKKMDGV